MEFENQELFEEVKRTDLSLKACVESTVFASPKPMQIPDIVELLDTETSVTEVENVLRELMNEYEERQGGFKLDYIKGIGYQFRTVQAAAPIMEKMFSSRPRPLSRAALETLSIIAYRQPTTRAVVEFVRGVDSGSIIKNLLDRNFIKCVGRKEDAGRPMLFGTTDEFLQVFGISSIDELPPLQSFQPSQETMSEALKELEGLEQVSVEEIVGDGEESPEVSEGVLGSLAEEAIAEFDAEEEADDIEGQYEEDQDNNNEHEGDAVLNALAEAALAEFDKDEENELEANDVDREKDTGRREDQDPEMAFGDGDYISEGSRDLDQESEDFD